MVPLCPGRALSSWFLVESQEGASQALGGLGPDGLGEHHPTPFLSPQGQLAQAEATAGGANGLGLDQLELAAWPRKPEPSSESFPSLGKGYFLGGSGGEQSGPAPALPLSKPLL